MNIDSLCWMSKGNNLIQLIMVRLWWSFWSSLNLYWFRNILQTSQKHTWENSRVNYCTQLWSIIWIDKLLLKGFQPSMNARICYGIFWNVANSDFFKNVQPNSGRTDFIVQSHFSAQTIPWFLNNSRLTGDLMFVFSIVSRSRRRVPAGITV